MRHTKIEMHCHTSCSDGVHAPSRLIELALDAQLTHIAITDHDTVDAYPEALSCAPASLKVIPAVELSTTCDGRSVHLLGYFIDHTYRPLLDEMQQCRSSRAERSVIIIQRLAADGYPIGLADFEQRQLPLNRSNIARLLFEKGATSYLDEAFEKLIGHGKPYYVQRDELDTRKAVDLVLAAGGVPVIAHPAHYHVVDLIEPLRSCGLMGIECFHSEQTPQDAQLLTGMARDLGMLVTGGSDYHGDAMHPSVLAGNQPAHEDIEVFFELGCERGCML